MMSLQRRFMTPSWNGPCTSWYIRKYNILQISMNNYASWQDPNHPNRSTSFLHHHASSNISICTNLCNKQFTCGHIRWRNSPRTPASFGNLSLVWPLFPFSPFFGTTSMIHDHRSLSIHCYIATWPPLKARNKKKSCWLYCEKTWENKVSMHLLTSSFLCG